MKTFYKAIYIASIAFCLNLPAHSQDIQLISSNITVKEAMEQLKEETGYSFVFSSSDVNTSKRVSITAKNATIEEVIKQILQGQADLGYEIQGKKIIIKKVQHPNVGSHKKIKVTGKVTDSQGDPIIGATIKEQDTTNGAITDMEGIFSFEVAEDARLEISYIGYQSQRVKVQNGKVLSIMLQEDTEMLEEVVVVGYGTVKKANVVGSIAKINSEAIQDRPVGRVEQVLQGQMAGVSVRTTSGTPGSDITINVRGAASINGESTPLYVVDGVPIDNLSGINPNDIESIDVLKDAASAAIYGSRGSNGVVLVTTKKGKTGAPVITLNAYAAISSLEKKVDVMDSDEWIAFNKKWYDYQWTKTTGLSASTSQADRIAYAEDALGKTLTTRDDLGDSGVRSTYGIYDPWWGSSEIEAIDWQDELFRTAPTYDIQLTASGATEKMNYSLSGGIYQQDGIVHGSSYDRYNLRANIEAQMTKRIKVGLSLAPSYGVQKGIKVEGKDNAVARALSLPGWVLAGSGRNSGADPYKFYDEWGPGPNVLSPYIQATAPDRKKNDVRINTSLNVTVDIIEGLKANGMVAWNYRNLNERSYTPTWANAKWDTASHPGELSTSSYSTDISNSLLVQRLLTYNKSWGEHSLDVLLGASFESNKENTSYQRVADFPDDKSWVFDATKGSTLRNNEIDYVEDALLSYFGRVQYAFKDRYLFSASLRRDGSSKFGAENRWGFFPSVSAAWKINEEPFMKDIDWIGSAKLRLSWGQAGNDRIGDALFLSNMSALNYAVGTSQNLANGYVPDNIANPLLGWETTTSYNIGIDFGVFNNRIYLSADYYKKKTKDLLLDAPVSLITGFSSMMANVGNVDNWGLEIELNTANISTSSFSWNSSLNISLNRNKITSLGDDNSDIRSGQGSTIIQRVGHPINSYMLLEVERTLRADDFEEDGITPKDGIAIYTGQRPGDTKWKDISGDGKITSDDYTVAGSYQPKFEWGFTNTFRYKDFDASILLQGRVGGKLLSIGSRSWNRATNDPKYNYLNRWLTKAYWSESEPGDGKTPAFYATVTGGQYDTNWLYDAGYVRIKNITLGYRIPFKPNSVLSKARVYVSCDNVYMWDNYDAGFSPEAATQDNASSDWGAYPLARTFSFGVNITF
ncbi:MAG: TonB-dependent receptor [Bacteroides sp.]|nr:TonB-dependent receptor [Bacteroides sp.]